MYLRWGEVFCHMSGDAIGCVFFGIFLVYLRKASIMEKLDQIEQIQHYLSTKADDRFINLVYGMIQTELANQTPLSKAHQELLDQRLADHQANPSQGKSWETMDHLDALRDAIDKGLKSPRVKDFDFDEHLKKLKIRF